MLGSTTWKKTVCEAPGAEDPERREILLDD